MPVEKSGQNEFDFEYGDDFGAHIEKFDPDFSKVLVRYNPDDDAEMNERQLGAAEAARRLAARRTIASSCSSCWCRPPTSSSPAVGRRHRPLRRRAAARADAPRDRGHPERRHRGRHLEDRGRRRARRRRDARRAGPLRRRVARASPACCSVAAPRPRRSSSGSSRPRRSRASSASRSGARSGGTRSRATSASELDREAAATQIADNYLHFVQRLRARQHAGALQSSDRYITPRDSQLGRLAARWR